MIYLDNNQSTQDLFIPRQSAKSVSGTTDWASKEYVNGLMDAETARTESTYAKKTELSAYTPTTGFTTINGQPITNGGDITIEGTAYQGGANIKITGNTISVTGIPTTFKTINGSGITGTGNLEIEGAVYSAGTNINIDSANVISVTGITVPTKVSDLENDEHFATTGWVESQGYLTEHQSLSAYSTTAEVENMVSAATAATTGWVEDQHYLTEHQSLSAYSTTEQVEDMVSAATAATTGWVESQGYLTEHQSLSAYTPTSGFSTINGSAITSGGAIVIDSSASSAVTQAQYDAMVSAGTIDPDTIYVITDAPTIDIDDLASKRLQELNAAPSSPVDGDVVNFEDGLYKYVDGSGQTGFWSTTNGTVFSSNVNALGFALAFSHIPNGQQILEFRRNNNGNWKQFKMENGVINVYDNSGSTPSTTITKNSGIVKVNSLSSSSYWLEVDYRDNYIGFYKNGSTQLQNMWEGITSTAHYEKISIPEPLPLTREYYTGIPSWNERGEVVGRTYAAVERSLYINSTTSANYRMYMLLSANAGSNVPQYIFAPTTSGETGQVLIAQGNNAAPIWQTMIKAVKISADDYDALVQAGTTDENTLYLIVD